MQNLFIAIRELCRIYNMHKSFRSWIRIMQVASESTDSPRTILLANKKPLFEDFYMRSEILVYLYLKS